MVSLLRGRPAWKFAEMPTRTIDPGAVVDAILEGLADARQPFEHGTMEERKRVIRAFVEGITLDAASQSAELTVKKLPEPDLAGAGNSFVFVAGVRHEAQERKRERETGVVTVRLSTVGGTFVPASLMPV
jgi:hypothetical protein